MTALETKLWRWMRTHMLWICGAALLALGAYLRYKCLPLDNPDQELYYIPWMERFCRLGLAGAIASPADGKFYYNYSPAFSYLFTLYAKLFGCANPTLMLKLTGCALEAAVIVLCLKLIADLLPPERKAAGLLTGLALLWLNPLLVLNTSAWGQTDVYYLLPSVLSLWLLLRGKPGWGMICLGVALCFKLQAIFLLPFFMIAWFCGHKRFSLLWFLALPGIALLSGVPMLLIGESPLSVLKVYIAQGNQYSTLSMHKLNLYTLMGAAASTPKAQTADMFFRTGILLCAAALGGMALWMIRRNVTLNGRTAVLLAAWCVTACVFFLPRMHERYGLVGEVLLCCWAVCLNKPRGYLYALVMILTSLNGYAIFLFKMDVFTTQTGSFLCLGLFCALTWEVVREAREPKGEARGS